jgi:hypothetical protein
MSHDLVMNDEEAELVVQALNFHRERWRSIQERAIASRDPEEIREARDAIRRLNDLLGRLPTEVPSDGSSGPA